MNALSVAFISGAGQSATTSRGVQADTTFPKLALLTSVYATAELRARGTLPFGWSQAITRKTAFYVIVVVHKRSTILLPIVTTRCCAADDALKRVYSTWPRFLWAGWDARRWRSSVCLVLSAPEALDKSTGADECAPTRTEEVSPGEISKLC